MKTETEIIKLQEENKRLAEKNKRLQRLCKLREKDYNDICDLLYKEEDKNKKLTEERDTFRECAYNLQKYVKSFAENQAQGYEPSAAKAAAEMEMWRVIALEKKALTEDNEAKDETITNLLATIADIQADTVRKMQERLKAEMRNTAKYSFSGREYSVIVEALIDQIAKEMLEGENEN